MSTNELIVWQDMKPVELFNPDTMENAIAEIEKRVKSVVVDVSTPEGQANVRSFARKISTTKSAIEGMRKDLVIEKKRELAKIDEVARHAKRDLDMIHDDFRKPLTEIEEREAARKAKLQEQLTRIEQMPHYEEDLSSKDIEARIAKVEEIYAANEWEEFSVKVISAKDHSLKLLREKFANKLAAERKAVEEERQRKEAEEKARLEREEQIRKEAEEKAKREAEEERQRIIKEKELAEERAKWEAQKAKEAEERAIRQEQEAKERAARQAEEARQDAIRQEQEKARKEKEEAERTKKLEQEAEEKRIANQQHRAQVMQKAAGGFVTSHGMSFQQAMGIVESIVDGRIPNVTVNF